MAVLPQTFGRLPSLLADVVPQATRPGLIARRDQRQLSFADKKRLRQAWERLIEVGFFGALVARHMDMSHRMHGSMTNSFVGYERFLPWHRVYLARLGEALRGLDADLALPYWCWSTDRQLPDWLADFDPEVTVPGVGVVQVARAPGVGVAGLPAQDAIADILAQPQWHDFTRQLEGVPFGAHNQVHVWVGGTMNTLASPADPVFWLHHCEIDRLWESWRVDHPGQGPAIDGDDAVLDPWSMTVAAVASPAQLNYRYDRLGI